MISMDDLSYRKEQMVSKAPERIGGGLVVHWSRSRICNWAETSKVIYLA